jgi:hypothetical protein
VLILKSKVRIFLVVLLTITCLLCALPVLNLLLHRSYNSRVIHSAVIAAAKMYYPHGTGIILWEDAEETGKGGIQTRYKVSFLTLGGNGGDEIRVSCYDHPTYWHTTTPENWASGFWSADNHAGKPLPEGDASQQHMIHAE